MADGDEGAVFHRGGQDAVLLREVEGGAEGGEFGGRVVAEDTGGCQKEVGGCREGIKA